MFILLFTGIYQTISQALALLSIKDMLEIIVITMALYFFLVWISRDTKHAIILYCYAYGAALACSFFLFLPVLQYLLILYAPIMLVVFILFHQELLQRNFVSARAPACSSNSLDQNEIIDLIIRASLVANNKKKEIFFILESGQTIDSFLTGLIVLDAPLESSFLDLILSSQKEEMLIFLVAQGRVRSLATGWQQDTKDLLFIRTIAEKTDCIIVATSPKTATLSLFTHNGLKEKLSAIQATTLLRQYHKAI